MDKEDMTIAESSPAALTDVMINMHGCEAILECFPCRNKRESKEDISLAFHTL